MGKGTREYSCLLSAQGRTPREIRRGKEVIIVLFMHVYGLCKKKMMNISLYLSLCILCMRERVYFLINVERFYAYRQ